MKKYLLILFTFYLYESNSQVVFCPAGAEWTYSYKRWINSSVDYETNKYVRDSVINQDTFKVIYHRSFYLTTGGGGIPLSLIKQKGDTVFMRNGKTNNIWQILYNFAALPGQNWVTNFNTHVGTQRTYTFTVDSVNHETINGFSLKNLFVKVASTVDPKWYYSYKTFKITERLGCRWYMFMFGDEGYSDVNWISPFLCYKDNIFGLKQLSSLPCDYRDAVGIDKSNIYDYKLEVYPNPAKVNLQIETNMIGIEKIQILNSIGLLCLETHQVSGSISVSHLPKGIYLVRVINKNNLAITNKIILE